VYDIRVRFGLLALAVAASGGVARADGFLEGTGFLGVDDFGDKIGLGDSLAPEQRPQTSPMVGGRLTYIAIALPRIELGAEAELTFTPSWTGYGFDGPRMSYFAPVFGYRGALVVRFPGVPYILPHILAGGGGETVVSGSPFIANGTDPLLYYGVGITFDVAPGWKMRFDARQGFMPGSDGNTTETYELLVGVGTRFGASRSIPAPKEHVEIVQKPIEPPPDPDTDGDGIPDSRDKCPLEPETKNGIEDEDGCPEPDPDGDGIVGKADKCPDQAEDFDHFQDEDGCPDPDNDNDGIVDAKDKCPNDPETRNGYEDDDGCPDTVPEAVVDALDSASAAKFEPGKTRLTDAAKAALDRALKMLRTQPHVHVVITGHPTGPGEPDKLVELAKKRAEVVKWYLVDEGIPADQLDTAVGAPSGATAIALAVAPKQ